MSTAKHEGDYWLTVDPVGSELQIGPAKDGEPWLYSNYRFWAFEDSALVAPEEFRPLADPDKPVRIRLTMEAEVIEDGE